MAGISLQDFFSLEISLQDIFSEITHTPSQKSNGRPLNRFFPFLAPFCATLRYLKTSNRLVTSAEREVKDWRRSGMYQSCNFLTRLGKQSL